MHVTTTVVWIQLEYRSIFFPSHVFVVHFHRQVSGVRENLSVLSHYALHEPRL